MYRGFLNSIRIANRQFLFFLFSVIVYLLIGYSGISILWVHIELFSQSLDWSYTGLYFYLEKVGEQRYLYSLTLAAITAQISLENLKERVKQNIFMEWKGALQLRIDEKWKYDPEVCKVALTKRRHIFNFLYKKGFNIDTENELKCFIKIFFKDDLGIFESNSQNKLKDEEADAKSYDSFRWILLAMLDNIYKKFEKDLPKIYKQYKKEIQQNEKS